mmetsp:Transcript_11503/g.17580  ORF Transcript_11503/g.17580 Transcript_11503/m.17580 type:complete len:194 (-) Transcript_11503:5-586(-)
MWNSILFPLSMMNSVVAKMQRFPGIMSWHVPPTTRRGILSAAASSHLFLPSLFKQKKGSSSNSLAFVTAGSALAATAVVTSCEEEADKDDEKATRSEFPKECLKYDTYNGVTVDVSKLNETNLTTFEETLSSSLKTWKEEERRGIWIKIPTNCAHLIPVCPTTTHTPISFHNQRAEKTCIPHQPCLFVYSCCF